MRLASFIVANTEAILVGWEAFARTILPAAEMDPASLRDHAGDILLATVRDMKPARHSGNGDETARLNGASDAHAFERLHSGFDLQQLVSEYVALRASVLHLWHDRPRAADVHDEEDVRRFHTSIDRSLAKAVTSYTKLVDEARDMFLAILSHDLRNPLEAISMTAEMLPGINSPDPKCNRIAEQISTSAAVMRKMIGDLLDYTRTRLGAGMPVNRTRMNLRALARAVVDEFRSAQPAATLELRATGNLTGEWDQARIRQVLSNLIGNALQHGDVATPIAVSLRGHRPHVTLAIRNHGPPIPPAELPRIFDPLVRGAGSDTPRRNRPGSIGLGLYIVRELVAAHGGTVAVTSHPTAGTAFTIHLPRHAARQRAPSRKSSRQSAKRPR